MKKALLIGAASLLVSTAAYAAPVSGSLNDRDGSANHITYSGYSPDNFWDDAGPLISANFTLSGSVSKTCSIMGVDGDWGAEGGLNGTVDLGTIGIYAGDDTQLADLFTMTGPANVTLHAAAAGCNWKNNLSLSKDSVDGLRNSMAGDYDSNQFQANIPYAATASFTGVALGAGAVAGTPQSVSVGVGSASANGNFGAWRSALDVNVNVPQVTGKGLVGGVYQGTLTLTLAII